MNNLLYAIFLLLILPTLAFAKTNTDTAFRYSAYFDGSYNYLANSNRFYDGVFDRDFDVAENGFTIQQFGINLGYMPQYGFGITVSPMIGRDTYTIAPYGWNPDHGTTWFGFAIPEAYAQYAIKSWTFMLGSLLDLAGEEAIYSYDDLSFSRSILFGFSEPTTLLGFRALYAPDDKLKVYMGFNNGWDNIRDTSRTKTIELGASYLFNPTFTLSSFVYSGMQRAEDRTSTGPTGQRTLLNVMANFQWTPRFMFSFNYDGGLQTTALLPTDEDGQAVWQGVAAYFTYDFPNHWQTSARGEVFADQNGYRTGIVQTWEEVTFTVTYRPVKNFLLRAETRHDFSNTDSFFRRNQIDTTNYQQSFALETVVRF